MDASNGSEGQPGAGLPRWVKISAIVVVALVVIVAAAMLLGGEHGPGRHFGGLSTPATVTSNQAVA
jgi:hypothetical protein